MMLLLGVALPALYLGRYRAREIVHVLKGAKERQVGIAHRQRFLSL